MKYLLRDRDGKYPALFDAILADTGLTVVLNGVQVPHLLHVLREYERHLNAHRPHPGISNAGHCACSRIRSSIRRNDRPGGLLHEYEHAA